jgi:hypothetical protein
MSCLDCLVADLVALHLLAYPRGSKIGFGVTQPYTRNQPTRSRELDRLQACRGARAGLVVSVRRNVHRYMLDLVKIAARGLNDLPAG